MRPFLVLVLVLAALGALLFGVLHFLGDPQPAQGEPGPAVVDAPRPPPTSDPALENAPRESAERKDTPSEPAEARSTATSDGQSYQYDNQLTGVVQNTQGQPVAGAEVSLSTYVELIFVGDPIDSSQDRSTRTDAAGRYSFARIEPRATYKLTAKHKDYKFEDNIQSVPVGEKGTFEEPPIVLTTGATLQGYVKDEGGNNVDGATLVLDGLLYQGAPYDPPDRMVAKTDVRGWYSFANVPAGQRQLSVSAQGYGTATVNSLVFTKDEVVPKDFTLQIGEMIRGRVMCQGQGIANATVQAFSLANTSAISRGQAVTDATGWDPLESTCRHASLSIL